MDRQELMLKFEHIPLNPRQELREKELRTKFQFLVAQIDEICPDSREKTRGFNAMDDALTLFVKSIARNT